tara:strand:+ start:2137 stop:2925 length:789 start_codon:yes stop_codon:yes gene_type:complete
MEAFRVADTRRRRLEDEFPELKREDNAFREEEECVAAVNTAMEHKAPSKKIETADWDRLAHLQNCPRRLLVASRRAVYKLPENKRKKRRGRPEQAVLELPKWASNHVKSFRQHGRDSKVTDFVPPLVSGFSEGARSDWDTVLDLYVKIHNDNGVWNVDSDIHAEEKKLNHLSTWILGSLQNMSESDRSVLKYFIEATVRALEKDEVPSSSSSAAPPGFTTGDTMAFHNPSAVSDQTNGGQKKKKKKKKKKGRVLDFSRKKAW